MKDPYDTLGVSKSASEAEIKKAFRTLAKKYHPDAAGNGAAAKKRFQDVSAAYEILGDKTKRAAYDSGQIDGDGNPRAQGFGGYGSGHGFGGRAYDTNFRPEDIFADLFGGAAGNYGRGFGGGTFTGFGFGGGKHGRPDAHSGSRSGTQPGQDYQMELSVPLREAASGTSTRVRLPDGTEVNVRIPAGIREGQQIRIKGRGGHSAAGRAPGDVLIEVKIIPDPLFTREGNNLKCDLPISLKEAVLGGKVPVETLTGKVALRIPPETSSGTVMRLKGKGISAHDGEEAGDLYVRLMIVIPRNDAALKRFVERWQAEEPPR